MMSEELKIKVSLDTSGINDGIKQIKNSLKDANTGFGGVNRATQAHPRQILCQSASRDTQVLPQAS